jgi:hypothetical protein
MIKSATCKAFRASGCKAKIKVFLSADGSREVIATNKHSCDLVIRHPPRGGGKGYPSDPRMQWIMSAYPPGIRITPAIKLQICRLVDRCIGSFRALTGCQNDRFFIPNLYGLDVSGHAVMLREFLWALYGPILEVLRGRHPYIKHFRIGLLISLMLAFDQGKVHFDYGDLLKKLLSELRPISAICAIDGFGFTYWGDNGNWQRIWCPEGAWIEFTDGCLHFGSANPFNRPAMRVFFYGVSDEAHYPPDEVYSPTSTDDFTDPGKGIFGCEEDQDRDFEWPGGWKGPGRNRGKKGK